VEFQQCTPPVALLARPDERAEIRKPRVTIAGINRLQKRRQARVYVRRNRRGRPGLRPRRQQRPRAQRGLDRRQRREVGGLQNVEDEMVEIAFADTTLRVAIDRRDAAEERGLCETR
jgi:hypothetical protein